MEVTRDTASTSIVAALQDISQALDIHQARTRPNTRATAQAKAQAKAKAKAQAKEQARAQARAQAKRRAAERREQVMRRSVQEDSEDENDVVCDGWLHRNNLVRRAVAPPMCNGTCLACR